MFEDVVQLLAQEGLLSIDQVCTDGTKIEANVNKYNLSGRSRYRQIRKRGKKLQEIWNYAQHIAADEDKMPEPPDLVRIMIQPRLKKPLRH